MASTPVSNPNVISAATARSSLGKILRRVKSGNERFVIEHRGRPEAVVMSIEDYFDLIAPAPESLKACWKAAEESGLDKMTMDEMDAEIAASRRERNTKSAEAVA